MSTCEPGRTVQLLDLITLPACIPMTNELYGVMVSTFALGGLVGGSSGGHLARWIGRRGTLLYNNAVFIVAALMMALSEDVAVLCLGRFVVGVACGVATAAAPMYLAEISPNRMVCNVHVCVFPFVIHLPGLYGLRHDLPRIRTPHYTPP